MRTIRQFHRDLLDRAHSFISEAENDDGDYARIHDSLVTAVNELVGYLDAKDRSDAIVKNDFRYDRFHYWIEQFQGQHTECGQQRLDAHNAILYRQTFMTSNKIDRDEVRKIYTLYVLLQLSMIGKLTLLREQQHQQSIVEHLQSIVRDFQAERRRLLQQLLVPIIFYPTLDREQTDFEFVGFKTEEGIQSYLKPAEILGFIDFVTATPPRSEKLPKESSRNQPKCTSSDKLDGVYLTFTKASYYEYDNTDDLATCGGEKQAGLMTGDKCKYKRVYRFSPTLQLWVLSCVVVKKRPGGREKYCLPIACKDARESDAALSRIINRNIRFVKEGKPFEKSDYIKTQQRYFADLDQELGIQSSTSDNGPHPPNNKLAKQVNLLLENVANIDPSIKQISSALRNVGQILARFGLYYVQRGRAGEAIPVIQAGLLLQSVVDMTLEYHLPASEFLSRELAKMIKSNGRAFDCTFDDGVQTKFVANMLAHPRPQYYIFKAIEPVSHLLM